ncbi:hypothetical protein TEA_019728 [Camellia sinensis var. sinensis]|uniref:30S ribosomal protein S8, chloroplastic n=1 Tax=Camellia sinensis var. sinensis TaxID=542762 RepID=A0A4S4E1R7_CAMSN|nr:hypothetical protein TEA_019728 [Camellia sinensis var. sinensis]
MVRVSVLNDALKSMYNAEKIGKRQVMIRPSSKVIIKFLLVMQKHGYIGEFEYVDDHRSGKIVVELNGRLNKCGVISPRFDVGVKEIEPWTARLLPSRQDISLASPLFFFSHKDEINLSSVLVVLLAGDPVLVVLVAATLQCRPRWLVEFDSSSLFHSPLRLEL